MSCDSLKVAERQYVTVWETRIVAYSPQACFVRQKGVRRRTLKYHHRGGCSEATSLSSLVD